MAANQPQQPAVNQPPAVNLFGFTPRANARTIADSATMQAAVSKTDRAALTSSERSKLKSKAETGLEFKFSLLPPLDGSIKPSLENLKGVYSVTIRVEEFRNSLVSYDMSDVFTIANSYSLDGNEYVPSQGAITVDLFTGHSTVDLQTVQRASEYFMKRGETYHVQNLLWSGTKLLNSCDEDLRKKIEEQLLGTSVEHRTGIVIFKIMINLVQASSASTMRVLTQQLEELTVKAFDGESIITYVSIMRGVIEQLRNNNAMPRDSLELISDGLRQSSTDEFNSYILHLMHSHNTGLRALTEDSLLNEAERLYMDLYARGKWEVGTKTNEESIFFNGPCFNCGKEGHRARDCPIKDAGGRDQGCGHGRFGRGQGRGGGRQGRGGGRGRGNATVVKEKSPYLMPPKPGEPHEKVMDGKMKHWCGRCSKWGDHSTKQHREMSAAMANNVCSNGK